MPHFFANRTRAVWALTLTAAYWITPPAWAQTGHIAIGKSLFESRCSGCHGLPPSLANRGMRAANNPDHLRLTLEANTGGMGFLAPTLSDQDVLDISTYLGHYQEVPAQASSETERVLNWAEWAYQSLLLPRSNSFSSPPYQARFYSVPGWYVGIAEGQVYLYDLANPSAGAQALGRLADFLLKATQDGF